MEKKVRKENPKKLYLQQVKLCRIKTEIAQSELEHIRAKVNTVQAIRYDKERTMTSPPTGSEVEELAVMLTDQKAKYLEALMTYQKKRDEVVGKINLIEDPRYSAILYARYIEERPWSEISRKLGYAGSHVRHLHGDALQAFKI